MWSGPTTGPKAQLNKTIVYVSEDQSNAGAAGVGAGVAQAAAAIGWKFTLINAMGTTGGEVNAMNQALALRPSGIVASGIDAQDIAAELRQAKSLGIPVVGWHDAGSPGPNADPPLFSNVQSDQSAIGTLAADWAVARTDGHAHVVIETWNIYAVSTVKLNAMLAVFKKCSGCSVLSIDNSPLTTASSRMPTYTAALVQKYGKTLTDVLMYNDGLADFMAPTLRTLGVPASGAGSVSLVAAGDGSPSAYQRIRAGSYQTATVPDPLNEEGWQIVDELNRALAGQPQSGYVGPVHLTIKSDVDQDGGAQNQFDPDNNYRQHYMSIWGVS